MLMQKLKIDDPLEQAQIHLPCGLWGLLSVGIFDNDHGVIYTGDFTQLGWQCAGAAAITGWSFFISFLYFYLLMKQNRFRVGAIYEILGMDFMFRNDNDEYMSTFSAETVSAIDEI